MASLPATHVSIDEYLSTEYEPDCDYVNGVLEDRNVGKKKHANTQGRLCAWLLYNMNRHGKQLLVEQRVRLSPSVVRIPDVCLVDEDDEDEVQVKPPALWVEILSPDDRFSRVHRKASEVLNFGVPMVWIIDPYERQAWIATKAGGIADAKDNILRCENLNIELKLEEILPAE